MGLYSLTIATQLPLSWVPYFRTHSSAFELQSLVALFYSIEQATTLWDHNDKWLGAIRKSVWQRADNENQNMPSTQALELHWHRCLWVLQIWYGATQNDIELPGKPTETNSGIVNIIIELINLYAGLENYGW